MTGDFRLADYYGIKEKDSRIYLILMSPLRENIRKRSTIYHFGFEEIYPYASGYSKEHEDYLKEAQGATALLQDGNRGYRALWEHVLNVSIADLKKKL